MILKETIFVQGRPVRDLLLDSLTRQVSFHPSSSPSLLQERDWSGPDELRQAVTQAYTSESPETTGLPILTENINLNHPKEVPTDAYA